jgi:replicative DNA helicase
MSRVIPQNIEAERAVLGTILLVDNSVNFVLSKLKANDFYNKKHRDFIQVAAHLASNGDPVDITTIGNQLEPAKRDLPYLAKLTSEVPAISSLAGYCKIIKEKAKARRLIQIATNTIDRCYLGNPVHEVTDDFGQEFFALVTDQSSSTKSIGKILPGVLDEISNRCEKDSGLAGIGTGFPELDKITNGLQSTDLIVLAARPAMGKTTLALNIAAHAVKTGSKTLFFSLEMGSSQLVEMVLTGISGVSAEVIKKGYLNDSTWAKIKSAAENLKNLPLMIDETPALSIVDLRARTKIAAVNAGVDLVIVDYMQLMSGKAESRERQIAMISAGLKGLAKELKIPVLALSQLNRNLESRTDKRPMLSDLRESGAIEQDADVVALIYRDEVYNKSPDNPCKGEAEIIIAKQRRGATGTVKLAFDGAKNSFSNLRNNEH